jgi:pimeloyl-ACP methyl ester carboxylesterase
MMQVVRTGDGRDLAVEDFGDPVARPVFFLHGTPQSRLCWHPADAVLAELGARLITYDRPGYGASSPHPGRTAASAAADIAAIADALGIAAFPVVGTSGGGPHALACAALLPDRVTRVAAVSSVAPIDAQGLDWYAGMSKSNAENFAEPVHQVSQGQQASRAERRPSSTPIRCTCSPPASSSTRPERLSSACAPAAPSAGSSLPTLSAWSATRASTRPSRHSEQQTAP